MMSLLALEVAFSIMLIGFAWASRIGWAHPLIRHCLQSVAEQKNVYMAHPWRPRWGSGTHEHDGVSGGSDSHVMQAYSL